MTPSGRRGQNNDHHLPPAQIPSLHLPPHPTPQYNLPPSNAESEPQEIFVDPAMGTPLSIHVEKDVPNYDAIVGLIKKHGGALSNNYSTVQYILVDRQKETGQNLYRQYHNKKGRVVLDSQWIVGCVQAGEMLTFKKNWGGFKVTGTETIIPTQSRSNDPPPSADQSGPDRASSSNQPARGKKKSKTTAAPTEPNQAPLPPSDTRPQAAAPSFGFTTPIPSLHNLPGGTFPGWGHVNPSSTVVTSNLHPPTHSNQPQQSQQPQPHGPPATGPPSHVANLSQVHHRPPPSSQMLHPFGTPAPQAGGFRGPWYGVSPGPPAQSAPLAEATANESPRPGQPPSATAPSFPPPPFEQWPGHPNVYYTQHQFPQFADPQYAVGAPDAQPPPPQANDSTAEAEAPPPADDDRGRKRKRVSEVTPTTKKSKYVPPPATNPASLVPPLAPPRRSPTPPDRVVRSTYGGNLFTAEDIAYLKKYIDWCVDMGMVLSLREICERLAVKAPHHTFYSWRRYCNKHKIKLGSYQMAIESTGDSGDEADNPDGEEHEVEAELGGSSAAGITLTTANAHPRDPRRSPTPPKSLHRSTTGKGIAFTEEDVAFMVKYMAYRKQADPNLNMSQFWNELAAKAPHHSRASWLKYWRRHRHEIEVGETGDGTPTSGGLVIPAPAPVTTKRQRYSHEDDILLAKFWSDEPQGTSDKLFQDFARMHPHHPWKGWQEHHRIHKTQIDHLIGLHRSGVDLYTLPAPPVSRTGRLPAVKEAQD